MRTHSLSKKKNGSPWSVVWVVEEDVWDVLSTDAVLTGLVGIARLEVEALELPGAVGVALPAVGTTTGQNSYFVQLGRIVAGSLWFGALFAT
jgi:hypothetical protein